MRLAFSEDRTWLHCSSKIRLATATRPYSRVGHHCSDGAVPPPPVLCSQSATKTPAGFGNV